ncbi:MAG: TerB family tellurite resistance protein [Pikeienuella sp.]
MSIWERIGEALSALASGESLSDVLAKLRTPPERSIGFTIAIIALGAKMAKADGQVTRDEVAAFRQIFSIPDGEEQNAARVFNLARNDVAGYDGYARQITSLFGEGHETLIDILDGLFQIAVADGHYHPGEDAFLKEVAEIFGVHDACFNSLRARHAPEHGDPYVILGVEHDANRETIRARWRQLVRETHPDQMIARGVPEEAVKLATRKLSEINNAYEAIMGKVAA